MRAPPSKPIAWAWMLLVGALLCSVAHADPWVPAGDVQARQDVELLADAGVLEIPVTTWPMPWGSIAAALATVAPDRLPPDEQAAYERLLAGIQAVQGAGDQLGYMVTAAPGRPPLRWFGNTPRGKEEAGASFAGYNGNMAFRFDVSAVYGSRDHQRGRLDGSYLSFALGNWILSAGAVDQYWGPAWSGSQILGNNARPVPGIILSRNVSAPFESWLLHWLGPWTFTVFAGQLDDNRYVPHPFLFGARFVFHPASGVELGISRTAQWGGSGRNQSWYCFWHMLIGSTKTTGNNTSTTSPDNCANNFASVDTRFHIPKTRLDFYSQMMAEDSGGKPSIAPSKWTGVWGLSMYGALGEDGAGYRAFFEYANTTVDSWGTPHINFAYEHHVYESGYRYRGFVLGYPTDNDSELFTLGVTLTGANSGQFTAMLRHGTINLDNTNKNEPWGGNKLAPVRTSLDEADAWFTPSFWGRHLTLAVGVTRWAPYGLPTETGVHGEVSWQVNFQ